MKYFLYSRDMISTCFYTTSGWKALLESNPNALADWIEIDEDLYEQGLVIRESGEELNFPLYSYNESGDKIAACTAISYEEAEKIMKAAEEKRVAEMNAAAEVTKEAPTTEETAAETAD